MKYQALLSSKDKIKYNKIVVCSISIISGRWKVDDERLCATRLRLRLRGFPFERGSVLLRPVVALWRKYVRPRGR